MHFGFALELTDTHLDLLSRDKYIDIPSKYFVCLHKIFKRSWRHVFKTSSKRLCKTSSRRLGRRKIVTLKTCWRRLQDMSSRPTNVCWEVCEEEPACQTLLKPLDLSIVTPRVDADLLKALAILSVVTIKRSAVDWEDLKTNQRSEKRPHFSRWSKNLLLINKFKFMKSSSFKHFTNHRQLSCRPHLSILKYRNQPQMSPSNSLENKISSDTYWRVQLIYMEVQTHSSLEPPLEYDQDQTQTPLTNQGWLWSFQSTWELEKNYTFSN